MIRSLLNIAIVLGCWLSLSGCSTPVVEIKGVKQPDCAGVAIVRDHVDSRKYLLEMFGVASIDGAPLTYSIQDDEGPGLVWCGSHRLSLVYLGYRDGKSYAPVKAFGEVAATLRGGRHYVVRGDVLRNRVRLWVEDENGARIAQVNAPLVPRNDSSPVGFPLVPLK